MDGGSLEPLVSRKVANCEARTEGYLRLNNKQIPTTKLGCDEQELHTEAIRLDEQVKHPK